MNSKQVIKMLRQQGWQQKKGKSGSSHRQFIHPDKKGKVTVPFHGKDEIPPKTLASIYKQAGS